MFGPFSFILPYDQHGAAQPTSFNMFYICYENSHVHIQLTPALSDPEERKISVSQKIINFL